MTVGAVARETPLGFLGVTLVPLMIVSDAVFDSLSDQMLQLVLDHAEGDGRPTTPLVPTAARNERSGGISAAWTSNRDPSTSFASSLRSG